ncbi:MAG: hypothetical protein H6553_01295 [Chitinophagales bacterium]|nr:hypothetical protein [Chitinophagales bacterium]
MLLLIQCKTKTKTNSTTDTNTNSTVTVDVSQPFEKLSAYHLFKGTLNDLIPNDGVLPYDLITPLFTDYAHKARFVWMPKGETAKYVKDEALDFPVGTVLIKNFYYPIDERDESKGRRIIETRLLIKQADKWEAFPYIWNDEQTDATLEIVGGTLPVSWINKAGKKMDIAYVVPNKNECKNCHNVKNVLTPIGPKVRNLNCDFAYTDGTMNQLEKWTSVGYLTGFVPADNIHNKLAKWNDETSGSLEERAKSYLEINCAHCHRPEGNANTTGLFLQLSEKNKEAWGIMKSPVAAGSGSGDRLYDVVPSKPDESILVYRMEHNDPQIRMPELGRSVVHQEGVDLVKAWIASMK